MDGWIIISGKFVCFSCGIRTLDVLLLFAYLFLVCICLQVCIDGWMDEWIDN